MAGLVHIYCGDGKGKTTAALGLAVRAAGAGKKVIFSQFYKAGTSSEIPILSAIPGVRVMVSPRHHGFFKRMNEQQREDARLDYTNLLERVLEEARKADLLVLDEAVSACNHGTIPEERIAEFLAHCPENLEVVLTGRNPSDRLLALGDYVTEMKKLRHPFDKGIAARKGIEF